LAIIVTSLSKINSIKKDYSIMYTIIQRANKTTNLVGIIIITKLLALLIMRTSLCYNAAIYNKQEFPAVVPR